MSRYAYWNQNTGQIVRRSAPDARLERLEVWHPIDPAVQDADAPAPVLDGVLGDRGALPHIPPPPAEEQVPETPTVPEAGPESAVGPQPAGPDPVKAPGKSASKADWVAYAVEHRGADSDSAEKLTRDQLAEEYGDADAKD